MSRARLSIIVYGVYLATAGAGLALIPNVILTLARIPDDYCFWARLAGCLALVLAVKGIHNSTAENATFFRFDNYTRTFAATFMVALVVLGIAPKIILLLAAVDYGGAIWTELAIRADKRNPIPAMVA